MSSGRYGKIYFRKMRVLGWLQDEKIASFLYLRLAFKRSLALSLLSSDRVRSVSKTRVMLRLANSLRWLSKSRLVTRCQATGRSHGVTRKTHLSRMHFRQYLHLGRVPNVLKRMQ